MTEIFNLPNITATAAIAALFALLKWLVSTRMDSVKAKRDSLALVNKALSMNLSIMSSEEKLLLEETLSCHYGKPIYVDELKVLLQAESPKSAIDGYLKYKKYLTIKEGLVSYDLSNRHPFITGLKFFGLYLLFAVLGLLFITGGEYLFSLINFDEKLLLQWQPIIYTMLAYAGGLVFIYLAGFVLFRFTLAPNKEEIEAAFKNIYQASSR